MNNRNEQAFLDKLNELPPERVAEVEDFVDFLRTRKVDWDVPTCCRINK